MVIPEGICAFYHKLAAKAIDFPGFPPKMTLPGRHLDIQGGSVRRIMRGSALQISANWLKGKSIFDIGKILRLSLSLPILFLSASQFQGGAGLICYAWNL
jgi:hypothetical protein